MKPVTLTLELPSEVTDGNWHKFSAFFKVVNGETTVYYPQIEMSDIDQAVKYLAKHGDRNLTYEKLMRG
jgi:hypothetical protein